MTSESWSIPVDCVLFGLYYHGACVVATAWLAVLSMLEPRAKYADYDQVGEGCYRKGAQKLATRMWRP